ncbi:ceramide-1-phosphate transfer protein-like [Lampetra planeri]
MADAESGEERRGAFRLQAVLDEFRGCVDERGDVLLAGYLLGWKELVRFMNGLGAVFSFISRDAATKINILQGLLDGEEAHNYRTLQAMARLEVARTPAFSAAPGHVHSGCRDFLRLHRALLWLHLFLEKLRASDEASERPSVLCAEAYGASLAQHHPWLVRRASALAFRTLPARQVFLARLGAGPEKEVLAVLGEAVPAIVKVYDISQRLYEHYQILSLP